MYGIFLYMSTVTITKTQYKSLKERADAYERIVSAARRELFTPPPVRSVRVAISAFRKTGKYNEAFLKSLERGLRESTFFEF